LFYLSDDLLSVVSHAVDEILLRPGPATGTGAVVAVVTNRIETPGSLRAAHQRWPLHLAIGVLVVASHAGVTRSC
jgi:hypothetical protein